VRIIYLLLSISITAVWVHCARTEFLVDRLEITLASGQRLSERYCSIVRSAQGRMFTPFVRRRLLVDLARALVWVMPDSVWSSLRDRMRQPASTAGWFRAMLERQQWQAEDCPLLCCAYFLIACSVLGFLFTCRWLVTILYESPQWIADLAGAVLGVALLGGNGDWHYCGYPYDFPQAFVFALTLAAMLAGRWWFLLVFVAAAYSKETSVLLIAGYVMVDNNRRTAVFWERLALMIITFGVIRGWLAVRYATPQPPAGFWVLGRNLKYLSFLVFYSWVVPFFVVGLARLVALRSSFPPVLVRLCLLALPLFGMALFVGWLEELRQYLELLPIFGLLVFHWCMHETGLGHLLKARALVGKVSTTTLPTKSWAA
jgi:hypothetical protein